MIAPEKINRIYGVDYIINAYNFYFNIQDGKRPIFTPIHFYNSEASGSIEYDQIFRAKGHKNYIDLINTFLNGETTLKHFRIRDKQYLVGKGSIFRYFCGEDTIDQLFPIIMFCFDENTDWNNQERYKIIVNTQEFDSDYNKVIRPKIQKLINKYVSEHNSDLIYTSNLEKYCFNPSPKLEFKSIKQQKEYLQSLVDQVLPKEVEEKKEVVELAF